MFVGTGLEVVQAVIKAIRTKIHLVKWFELLLSICLLLFLINFIGIQLLYNVVLVSTVQQSESAICIHMPHLFWISFPFRSPESTEESSLHYTVASH